MTIIINRFIDKSIVQDNFDTLDPLQKLIGNKFVMSGENDGFQGDINIDLSVSNPHQTWVWDVNPKKNIMKVFFQEKNKKFLCYMLEREL